MKNPKFLPLIIGLSIAFGVILGGRLNFTDTSDNLFSTNSKKDKLNRLIDYIDYEYVDAVNTDSIVDVTVNGILQNLDPHSTYIPKDKLSEISQTMKGAFVGVGISYYKYNDTISVIKPHKNGPSDKAGIKRGDRILMANNDTLYGEKITSKDISLSLKGEIDSEVNLLVYRKANDSLFNVTVSRSEIPIKSVEAYYMLTEKVGYIKLNRFAESSYREFKKALKYLKQKGAKEITLDLRDNPGGFLGIAEQIADEFLKKNKLILFTKDKRGNQENVFATKRGDFEEGQIYVLINGNSASASEVIAGALQDNDKGIIIGRRSFGKGLVQQEMALGDGSAVRLTVSRYYTPTGRSIQKPYVKGESKTYYNEYYKRLGNGELYDKSQIKLHDSLKFTTPKGKIVYGGGGIIPDVFVPINTIETNETLNYIKNRGYYGYFVFEFLDNNASTFTNITEQEFFNDFEVNIDLFQDFENYINRLESTNISLKAYKDSILLELKATLASQLFNENLYYQIINNEDDMVKQVLNLSTAKATITN